MAEEVVHVHLAGSRLGPAYRSVDVVIERPPDWTNERVRWEAAKHYGVPPSQVDDPYPRKFPVEGAVQ